VGRAPTRRAGAAAEQFGFPAAHTAFDLVNDIFKRDSDMLKFDYEVGGVTYRQPDGPVPFPHPTMCGARGMLTLKRICTIFGTRPHTLVHGRARFFRVCARTVV
jgi:hypothetical protein